MEAREPAQSRRRLLRATTGRISARRVWWGLFLLLGVMTIALVASQWYGVKLYYVASRNMSPTLELNDRLLVDQMAYRSATLKRNDIVLVTRPGGSEIPTILRVIGLPGETIEIREKQVYINGRQLDDEHAHFRGLPIPDGEFKNRDLLPLARIPGGQYFLLGDNRDDSFDSRFWGPVARERIRGVVRRVLRTSNQTGIQ